MSGPEFVAARIAERYAHPGRVAYLYLFQLEPGSDFSPLMPPVESTLAAWLDEGGGLAPVAVETAVERCRAAIHTKPDPANQRAMTSNQRRQMMARSILFSVTQPADDLITVRLLSRALHFSPKGDREAFEEWHRAGEGWYSAYQPD